MKGGFHERLGDGSGQLVQVKGYVTTVSGGKQGMGAMLQEAFDGPFNWSMTPKLGWGRGGGRDTGTMSRGRWADEHGHEHEHEHECECERELESERLERSLLLVRGSSGLLGTGRWALGSLLFAIYGSLRPDDVAVGVGVGGGVGGGVGVCGGGIGTGGGRDMCVCVCVSEWVGGNQRMGEPVQVKERATTDRYSKAGDGQCLQSDDVRITDVYACTLLRTE